MIDWDLIVCSCEDDYEIAKNLTTDYMDWLGVDLCFQNIDKEFEVFETMYGQPQGCFIYILHDGEIVAGVGLRYFKVGVCEMKRLFVYEDFRGFGYGKVLCEKLMEKARSLGYVSMILDTVIRLKTANALYESIGFKDIPSYYDNPEETVRYMGIDL